LMVMRGNGGSVNAAPGVNLVLSDGKTLRRIGDRRYDARIELGEDPGKVMIDGVSYSNGCDRMGARRWAPCLLRMPVQPNYGGRTTLCCQRRRFRPHTVVQPSGRKPCGVLQRRSPGSRLVP